MSVGMTSSIEPLCPNCGAAFAKLPERKTRCRSCGQYTYVRTHPLTNMRALLSEQELAEVEALWTTHHRWKRLTSQYQVPLTSLATDSSPATFPDELQADALLSFLKTEAARLRGLRQPGLYRNAIFDQAELSLIMRRHHDALCTLLTVCWLDLKEDHQLARASGTPFDALHAIPPGVRERLAEAVQHLSLDESEVRHLIAQACAAEPTLSRWEADRELMAGHISSAIQL